MLPIRRSRRKGVCATAIKELKELKESLLKLFNFLLRLQIMALRITKEVTLMSDLFSYLNPKITSHSGLRVQLPDVR